MTNLPYDLIISKIKTVKRMFILNITVIDDDY